MTVEKSRDAVWETPAPRRGGKYNWNKIAEDLRAKPGAWLKVYDRDNVSYAVSIRAGDVAALQPNAGFEVLTRRNTRATAELPRMCTLYLRYNPKVAK